MSTLAGWYCLGVFAGIFRYVSAATKIHAGSPGATPFDRHADIQGRAAARRHMRLQRIWMLRCCSLWFNVAVRRGRLGVGEDSRHGRVGSRFLHRNRKPTRLGSPKLNTSSRQTCKWLAAANHLPHMIRRVPFTHRISCSRYIGGYSRPKLRVPQMQTVNVLCHVGPSARDVWIERSMTCSCIHAL